MNKKHILVAGSLLFASFAMNSCLDFDDPGSEMGINSVQTETQKYIGDVDNIDYKKEISAEGAFAALETFENNQYLASAKGGIYCMRGGKEGGLPGDHAYQMQYSLGPDCYAQYFVVSHKDFPYSSEILTSTYNIAPAFNGGPHGVYGGPKPSFMQLLNHPQIDSIPEIKAVFLLYYSIAAQEMADLSGPFTYLEDKKNLEEVTEYNDVRTIYYGIYDNLNTIIACLKNYDAPNTRSEDYKAVIQDILINYCPTSQSRDYSNMNSFIRLANSLKLRMAMHMTKVEPETARKWAEEAVADGVIENAAQQHGLFPLNPETVFTHPLVQIATGWNDLRISASFESLLMSLDHPYSKYLFKENSGELVNKRTGEVMPKGTRICGIRAGTLMGDGQTYTLNKKIAYSTFDADYLKGSGSPLYFIKWAEVDFLRAEGALRGWTMGGTAQEFYERGIKNAYMEGYSSTYDGYLKKYMELEKPLDYVSVEPMGEGKDLPSVTKIGVKWDDKDAPETMLEKIITQKYLALFPLSTEAWTELRRTGYPKLFPVLNTDEGDGSIEEGEMIRRIPWVPTDPIALGMVENSGIPALGGKPDEQATRLWWDVDAPNF